MTSASKTGIALSDVDNTIKHRGEDQCAGLFQNLRKLAVQFCKKSAWIGGVSRMRFDQRSQHRRNQRCAHPVPHYVADANTGSVVAKPRDVKEITAHHTGWDVTMIKAQS